MVINDVSELAQSQWEYFNELRVELWHFTG